MNIGRKIYYQLSTGNVLVDIGEKSGSVVETTIDQDFQFYTMLQGIQQNEVGFIQCDYGYMLSNFQTYPYHIDITKNPIDETAIVWDTNNAYGASLSEVQTTKIAQIQDLYSQELNLGFTSSASGAPIQFAYGISDQNKFLKLLVTITAGMVTYPVTVYAKDTTTYSLTQTQVMQLYSDISKFEMGLEGKLHDFINQIQACTTIDEVNAIVVNF